MHPLRPALPRRRFPWYAVLLYVGLLAALVAADAMARRAGLDPVRTVTAMVLLIPVCLVGARALVVALHWSHFRARPAEILRVEHGGAAMYGALPPALLLSAPLLRWMGLPFGAFWDVGAVAILAGMILTRLGCLLNGCCAGRQTHGLLGIRLRNARGVVERRLPNPVFEALLGGVLLLLAVLLWNVSPFPGAVFLFVASGYAVGRFLLERLRERRAPVVAGLGAFQWMSLGLLAASLIGLTAGWSLGGEPARLGAAAPASASSAHLFASGLLLLPVLYLFRFLGCDLIFTLDDPIIHRVRLGATVPGPVGEVTAEMKLVRFDTELAASPFDLTTALPLDDGRVAFGITLDVAEGSFVATCTVRRNGVEERVSEASGEVNAPDLVVLFEAPAGDATGVLNPRLVFQAAVPQSLVLGVAVPDVGGTGPFTATMELEGQFGEGVTTTDLPFVGPVGALQGFQAGSEATAGFYRATCTVARQGAITRIGQCGGDHDAPGEEVAFRAVAADPPNTLTTLRCFELP